MTREINSPEPWDRPEWVGKPGKFMDLLMSPAPWRFEQEAAEHERNQSHAFDNLMSDADPRQ